MCCKPSMSYQHNNPFDALSLTALQQKYFIGAYQLNEPDNFHSPSIASAFLSDGT